MATGLEEVLASHRTAQSGIHSLGEGFDVMNQRQLEEEDRRKKEEASKRLQDLFGKEVQGITELGPLATPSDVAAGAGRIAAESPAAGTAFSNIFQQVPSAQSEQEREEARTRRSEAESRRRLGSEAAGRERVDRREAQKLENDLAKQHKDVAKRFDESDVPFRSMVDSFDRKTPAGDLSGLTQFMRFIDPGSRVTDADFKNAEAARKLITETEDKGIAVPGFLKSLADQLDPEKGTKLTDEQRQDFKRTAQTIFSTRVRNLADDEETVLDRAERFGVDPKAIVGKRKRISDVLNEFEKKTTEAPKEVGKAPNLKVINASQLQSIMNIPQNQQAFAALKAKKEAEAGRPLTPDETQLLIKNVTEKLGFTLQQ